MTTRRQQDGDRGRGRTLADGAPGSGRPLHSARPEDTAHEHSVARNPDPHGDSKLAAAQGDVAKRLHRTLAEAGGKEEDSEREEGPR